MGTIMADRDVHRCALRWQKRREDKRTTQNALGQRSVAQNQNMSPITENGHTHGEAFMLMRYICEAGPECGHVEYIWNSRDGVTPFGIGCPSCGSIMHHGEWQHDIYAPEHELHHHQRFFRDGTKEDARAIMRRRFEQMKGGQYAPDQAQLDEIMAMIENGTASEFPPGWPMLDVYTGGDLRERVKGMELELRDYANTVQRLNAEVARLTPRRCVDCGTTLPGGVHPDGVCPARDDAEY